MNNRRTGSALVIVLAIVGGILILGMVYYAFTPRAELQTEPQVVQNSSSPDSPQPGYKRVQFEKLSFEIPDSWENTSRELNSDIKEYGYSDPSSGDYI